MRGQGGELAQPGWGAVEDEADEVEHGLEGGGTELDFSWDRLGLALPESVLHGLGLRRAPREGEEVQESR